MQYVSVMQMLHTCDSAKNSDVVVQEGESNPFAHVKAVTPATPYRCENIDYKSCADSKSGNEFYSDANVRLKLTATAFCVNFLQ